LRQEQNNIFARIDWLLVFLFIILVGFGWMNIYAASKADEDFQLFNFATKYGKQAVFIILTIPLIVSILFFNSKFYEQFASIFYIISLISLVGLFVFGKEINGAKSWYNFGVLGLQPSEFVKAFTALAVAKLLSDRQYNLKLIKNQIKVFIIIFTPAFLITLQPDAGSALIYLAFFFVLNREGLTLNYLIIGSSAIFIFILSILIGSVTVLLILISILSLIVIYATYKYGKRFLRFNWYKMLALYLAIGFFIFGTNFTYNKLLVQEDFPEKVF